MTKAQMQVRIDELTQTVQDLTNELELLKENAVHKSINERNAGRKTKITDFLEERVLALRNQGMSYRNIAEIQDISVGLVFKICNPTSTDKS